MAPAADVGIGSPGTRPGGSITDSWKAETEIGALRVAGVEQKKRDAAGGSGSGEFTQVSGRCSENALE